MKKLLIVLFIITLFFGLLFYGPVSTFKEFFITTTFSTGKHRFLAELFYSEEEIYKVLNDNKIEEGREVTDQSLINFSDNYVFHNKYEKQILKHKKDDLYKVIDIYGKGYNGFLVAIYDPSKVLVATSKYLGKSGEKITSIAKRYKAKVVMNACGFYDPDWKSNGASVHGTLIKNGKIIASNPDAINSGGFIGFSQDNKLVLGKFSKHKALEIYRDAIEFGPFLIINGKSVKVSGNGGLGIAPRSAIGQRKDGIVLFLVINGRIPSSIGADMNDLIKIFKNYGAINAANLDGGSSTELYVDGKVINTPTGGGVDGLRKMPAYFLLKE